MAAFEFTALDETGRERKGVLDGDVSRQIRQQIRDKGWTPLTVTEVRQKENKQSSQKFSFKRGIKSTDLALITRQFATLVRAGLSVEEALSAVSKQSHQPRLRNMLMAVRSRVMEGHTLATALADFPHAFSDLYRSTVSAGEQSGHLDMVLERLADYTESRQTMQQKMTLALIYPIMISIVAVVVITALLAYVVPQVVQVFENTGQELPILTVIMISLSDLIREYGLIFLILLVLAIFIITRLLRKPGPKQQYHRFLLKLPLVSSLVRGFNSSRFARTFSILTASSVPVLEGLRISSSVISNIPMRNAVEDAATMVKEGAPIHTALERSGYFPPMTVQLIASGENSGRLEEMLERAADSQEKEMESTVATLVGLFEPFMILFMGVMVLLIVLAILLPIFDLNQLVK
ncbi:MAG: type II secretion system inner membrane protein GspF [Gammaproteobacteria bacterium]|nr:type II secretion system inner membrane protein GspF [Gammaproteobacteria bacterium]